MLLPFIKQKQETPQQTASMPALVDLVLKEYLRVNQGKLGKDKVSSMLLEKYNTDDTSRLSDTQKYEIMVTLYEKSKEVFGYSVASSDLEKTVKGVVSRYGVTKGYFELLGVLPSGVLENEKLSVLGREDLEEKVRQRTQELEISKEELEKRVAERTNELESERNKFRIVLYNTVDGVFALDRDKRVIAFNKAMEDMTGFLESEVLGNNVDEYVKFAQKDGAELTSNAYCPLIKVIEERKVYKAENIILKGRTNKEFYVSVVSTVIAEGANVNVGCIVTVHDVTNMKELETMKLDFVSIAAHELRTPLTSIRGYLSLLISELDKIPGMSDDQKIYLERSYLSSNQLFSLVENLLNVSRIERGGVVLSKDEVNWMELVQQTVQSFVSLANERKVKLTFMPTDIPTDVMVDAIMIGEVLSNLLDNAIRYTGAGGTVLVFLEVTDKFVITHVKDSGQGIPKESLPHLFTKFYRVSGTLEQGSKGTGLGLYISREIVKLHGGDIWVDSDLGKGSTFSFSVPRA
ncbi:MAG: ATP-binding protein [Patescibacteria group bacterium]